MADSIDNQEVIRDKSGRFQPGKSGNPKGRPLGSKSRIAKAKRDLELLLREDIVKVDQIKTIWEAMVREAQDGNVSAAKLVLDKVMSQAQNSEDDSKDDSGITVKITNLTLATPEDPPQVVVEGQYTTEEAPCLPAVE